MLDLFAVSNGVAISAIFGWFFFFPMGCTIAVLPSSSWRKLMRKILKKKGDKDAFSFSAVENSLLLDSTTPAISSISLAIYLARAMRAL
jgi:hypothetical protein